MRHQNIFFRHRWQFLWTKSGLGTITITYMKSVCNKITIEFDTIVNAIELFKLILRYTDCTDLLYILTANRLPCSYCWARVLAPLLRRLWAHFRIGGRRLSRAGYPPYISVKENQPLPHWIEETYSTSPIQDCGRGDQKAGKEYPHAITWPYTEKTGPNTITLY